MSEMIDRQDVIDLLQINREEEYKKSLSAECKHKSVIRSKHDAHVAFCDYLIECVKQLPSAQNGKWIYGEHDVAMCDGYRCDKCGFFVPWDYQHKFIDFIKDYNYCPSCGADMRSEVREYLEYGKLIAKGIAQGLRGDTDDSN